MKSESSFSPALVVPTYNNAQTLGKVVAELLSLGLPLLVVDDGATDATASVLGAFQADSRMQVITHAVNRGKAAALRTGFLAARERGFSHAVTIDSDDQLNVSDIPRMIEAAAKSPMALIIGTRDDSAGDYPARSRTGRRVSNFLVLIESGLRVSDSQCGLRVYPLPLITAIRCDAERFGFETEIITRTGWAGGEIREVPVSCKYEPPDKHVSHFRPWIDSFRAAWMHIKLIGRAITPWPHKKLVDAPPPEGIDAATWKRLTRWFSPARMWRELREQSTAPRELATGLAIGVFIANLPIYGLQTLLGLYTARRLHLNPLGVVAGTHVSTPPVGPLLIAGGIGVGHLVLHGRWIAVPLWPESLRQWIHLVGSLMVEWTVGSLIVGAVLATAVFFVASALFRLVAMERD